VARDPGVRAQREMDREDPGVDGSSTEEYALDYDPRADGEVIRDRDGEVTWLTAEQQAARDAYRLMHEDERLAYLDARGAEIAGAAGAEEDAIRERMLLEGVSPDDIRQVAATAADEYERQAAQDAEEAERGRDSWGHYDPPGSWWPGPTEEHPTVQAWIDAHPEAEELSEEEINRIDADRERAEEEAFEDERQPGGPLWDAEHGRPYDDATCARLINESRYPELAAEGEREAGRGGGQPETAEPKGGVGGSTYISRRGGGPISMSNAAVGPAPGFDLAGPGLSPASEADLEAGS
jgi:hypothetical protein